MRRLVAIPIKTLAVTIIILAGALYMAAEARQAVVRRQENELVRILERPQAPAPRTSASTTSLTQPDNKSESRTTTNAQPATPVITTNTALKEDGHKRQVVVSIPDRKLALLEDGLIVKTYPIAVGARFSPSPDGDFVIINHAVNPVYRHKDKEIQPGKDNPLGSRWMGLSLKGYGIHGTNVPGSIGKAASHGCFRMHKEDVEDLYSRVQVGDPVMIRKERDALIAKLFPEEQKPMANASSVQVASAASGEVVATPAAAPTTGQ
jgi:lipoprotein-anchoring transpeptidase ErfK/SrfK